ncbi:MAG: histidinol dehydrogenase, partial [Verrucomicrobiota bacterium]|nr:histidinol dehydrogenase [Verrucomicrobiota bacterium]
QRTMTVQEASPRGLRKLGPVVERLATAENLIAHRRAVTVRLEKLAVAAVYDRRPLARRRS